MDNEYVRNTEVEFDWKMERQRLWKQKKKRKFSVIYEMAFRCGYDSESSCEQDPECPFKKGDKKHIWLLGFDSGILQARCDIDEGYD
jgi:ribosome modulation factor